ncbi:BamA/TamA family outer membrane protein [Flammeovirgaceae bacterium SG7u.111]|nr:BamA/TamA family outer membrane protein [Flammeovirgaceae bacterium SG7u.132]WPO36080.1 BamA/TamA family outer membrane protein [Flammeovirgaceae bacterium SG7u.111]
MKNIYLKILLGSLLTLSLFEGHTQDIPASADGDSSNFNFVPVPYLNYSRSTGLAVGALPMAMYKLNPADTISPSSIAGLLGTYSTNDTWFAMVFSKFYFNEDKWRATAAAGYGNINFQFYVASPIDKYVGYNTGAKFLFVELQRKVVDKLYFGVNYVRSSFDTSFDIGIPAEINVNLQGLGTILSYDRRDSVYYPRKGLLAEIKFNSFPEFFGNEFISSNVEIELNKFFPIKQGRDVVAARLYGGFGIGDLSFNQQFIIGRTDIRGYTQGDYRGDQMVAMQAEYRWNFHKKLGAVGFFGLATVFNGINSEDDGKILPGAGAGFRYMIFPKNHMNVGIDIAVGNGDWGTYFKIGEAF